MYRHLSIVVTCLLLLTSTCFAQQLRLVNRSLIKDSVIHLNKADGPGVAWISNQEFSNGTIEFDVKGKNVLQQSFVGLAFHGQNDSTYDAVYFRPFNFQVPEPGRRAHSVQYISLPKYDWFTLRDQYPGKYENEIDTATDPNNWFHVKLVIEFPEVTAYVNGKKCLSVTQICTLKTGMVGYWVGNGSSGEWRNISFK
ncbi:DUF1080 domain-containing protein [Chitinophaga polysaccharea]|uniref:family 16 glycoside hydrolase n=1 Tax=Chitinophaga TaxID=79328 RepID=UPI001455B6BD|nr:MULTISPECIES: family 16 glycoside hydrolase [Chitinophaga]NLR61599.1 DUF1080 domain-containing protein [Chitinophaga polysaccharea]NLU93806.1 DUF1080 domain-containing protein [Chitinophaga sp. Ak27]